MIKFMPILWITRRLLKAFAPSVKGKVWLAPYYNLGILAKSNIILY